MPTRHRTAAGLALAFAAIAAPHGQAAQSPQRVAALLRKADTWIMPQPKQTALVRGSFDLRRCSGLRLAGEAAKALPELRAQFPALLREHSGVALRIAPGKAAPGTIALGLFPNGRLTPGFGGITAADLRGLGEQGYALRIAPDGIRAAATGAAGLRFAARTLAQIATDRKVLPGLHIRDWPSMRYRGLQQDISRGQVPTTATLKRLSDVLAEAKMNMLELYIEHEFQSRKHPGFAPPEALTPAEGRELFVYASRLGVEVHPLLQVLGHAGLVVNKPGFQNLRVRDGYPWVVTYDIRKPEAVAFVGDLVDEMCETFPGKFLNVDITEIDVDGFAASGTKASDLTELIFQYVLKLRERAKKHGVRLMITQGPLDSTGSLAGMGPVLDRMPRDIVIGSYYTSMIYTGWDNDYPRLHKARFDFFAQPWIASHIRIIPDISYSMRFSESEVSKGLQFGAAGSTTTDWGDDGHYHLVGHEWYPALYHGAVAWTGAQLDRAYFDEAYCRLLYGTRNDGAARAVQLLGAINMQKVKVRDAAGKVSEIDSPHYWEFWQDPFAHPNLTKLADPAGMARDVLGPADEAARLLTQARRHAVRNTDNLDQVLFAARNYQALGHKLHALADFGNVTIPHSTIALELHDLAEEYEDLRADFRKLWLAEDRHNSGFQELLGRFNNTIAPVRAKEAELEKTSVIYDDADLARRAIVSIGDTSRLQRVLAKARRGEPIVVGTIGGSITAGAGASREENRWANRVAQWWRERFPKTRIDFVNAGIGATGSDIGAHRAWPHLLSHKPDFVVAEYAVNDPNDQLHAETLEGLIRQILSQPNEPAVMLLFTMNNAGGNAQEWHAQVGRHYGLPMVSFRDALWPEIAAGRMKWEDVEYDVVHPNDRGHRYCAEFIDAALDRVNALTSGPSPSSGRGEHVAAQTPLPRAGEGRVRVPPDSGSELQAVRAQSLPPPLISDVFEHTEMLDSKSLTPSRSEGWTLAPAHPFFGTGWQTAKPGSVLDLPIEGTAIHVIFYRVKGPTGIAEARIDSGVPIKLDAWFDQTWGGYDACQLIARDLPPGKHTLHIKLLDEKDPGSTGHEFRLEAVLEAGLAAKR